MKRATLRRLAAGLLAGALMCAVGAVRAAGEPAIVLAEFTGQVVITMPDGSRVTLEPGDTPPEIPSGATIEAVTGELVLEVMGHRAVLAQGAAVKVSADERRGILELEVITGECALFVGTARVDLGAGDAVRLASRGRLALLTVLAGDAALTEDGVTRWLGAGRRMIVRLPEFVRVPDVARPEIPEPAPVEASPFLP